ncbi:MAG: hypothetical protein OEY49_05770, partial [Candidatus Heimdallarchaeota archaeon]|nr:hypothetical protein [Candidatus Heimdallarchaeota archaeon]
RGLIFYILFSFSLVVYTSVQVIEWQTSRLYPPFQRPIDNFLLNTIDIIVVLLILCFYLHFTYMENESINIRMLLLLGFTLLPMFILLVLLLIKQEKFILDVALLILPLFSISVLITVYYAMKITIDIYFIHRNKRIKRDSLLLIIGYFYMCFSLISQTISSDKFVLFSINIEIYQLLLFVLGIILLIYVIYTNPAILYAIPYPIYEILVYDSDKLIWTSDTITKTKVDESQHGLRIKALNSTKMMLQEITGFTGRIEKIIFDKGIMIINSSETITVVVITQKSSNLLMSCLNQFSKEITSNTTVDEFEAKTKHYFPYFS